jgi:hypothetical protein
MKEIKYVEQDEHVDELAGIVQNIKVQGQNMGQEADLHNKLLDDLN